MRAPARWPLHPTTPTGWLGDVAALLGILAVLALAWGLAATAVLCLVWVLHHAEWLAVVLGTAALVLVAWRADR